MLLAVFAPILWGDKASAVDTENLLAGPSAQHWFGTDNLGRDLFYRVLVATRLSLMLTLAATTLGTVIGLVLGTAPLLLGGRLGRLVTAFVNVFVAFPGLLLVLVFAVIFGVGAQGCGAGDRPRRSPPASPACARRSSPVSPGSSTSPRRGSRVSTGSGSWAGTSCPTWRSRSS